MDRDFLTSDFTNDKNAKKFSPRVIAEKKPMVEKHETLPAKDGLSEMITTLRDVIMDDIDRVKKDKDYVHQAKAVNNHVNSVINLARLQYDILKTQKPQNFHKT